MGMTREQKAVEVELLNQSFAENETVIVSVNKGLSVQDFKDLRAAGRKEGATIKVAKNSLAKIAIKGTKFEDAAFLFTGPTNITASQDAVAAAKVAYEFAKDNGTRRRAVSIALPSASCRVRCRPSSRCRGPVCFPSCR